MELKSVLQLPSFQNSFCGPKIIQMGFRESLTGISPARTTALVTVYSLTERAGFIFVMSCPHPEIVPQNLTLCVVAKNGWSAGGADWTIKSTARDRPLSPGQRVPASPITLKKSRDTSQDVNVPEDSRKASLIAHQSPAAEPRRQGTTVVSVQGASASPEAREGAPMGLSPRPTEDGPPAAFFDSPALSSPKGWRHELLSTIHTSQMQAYLCSQALTCISDAMQDFCIIVYTEITWPRRANPYQK